MCQILQCVSGAKLRPWSNFSRVTRQKFTPSLAPGTDAIDVIDFAIHACMLGLRRQQRQGNFSPRGWWPAQYCSWVWRELYFPFYVFFLPTLKNKCVFPSGFHFLSVFFGFFFLFFPSVSLLLSSGFTSFLWLFLL